MRPKKRTILLSIVVLLAVTIAIFWKHAFVWYLVELDPILRPHMYSAYDDDESHHDAIVTLNWGGTLRYEGDYVDGKPNGKGVMTYLDGWRYEGEFLRGYPHGKGVITRSDGWRFEGMLGLGVIGDGVYMSPDGTRYDSPPVGTYFPILTEPTVEDPPVGGETPADGETPAM